MALNTSNGNVVTMVDANAKNVKTLDLTKEEIEAIVMEVLEGKFELVDYYLRLV